MDMRVKKPAPKKGTSTQKKSAEPKEPYIKELRADARHIPLADSSVDLVVTSPPYWQKRDYGFPEQIGLEATPEEFVQNLVLALREWRRVLAPHGSVFLNLGDSYNGRSLASIPGRLEIAAADDGWKLRNRIIWAKGGGMPDPAKNRLANRHEYIMHFTRGSNYYYDSFGYSERFGNGSTPSDVWSIPLRRDMSGHLAPFPEELVERAVTLACPQQVCVRCGLPRRRVVERTAELDATRPQAKRAMELAQQHSLTPAHIAAIQATGISDAGKALRVQTGTGKNSKEVKRLADEAKKVLGGYFREFTFARKRTSGWTNCECNGPYRAGIVLDPFKGTGTTLRVSQRLGRNSIGVDFAPEDDENVWAVRPSNGRRKRKE